MNDKAAPSDARVVTSATLDQLIALNDEIASLTRAGVPLEQGLGSLADDLPGRLGAVTKTLAQRMEAGCSLGEAMDEQARSFPPVYRAVVQAGIRSGKLSAALESLAGAIRQLADTRRTVVAAFVYPLLVVLVAWAFFLVFLFTLAPRMASFLADSRVPGRALFEGLAALGASAPYWGLAVPAVVLALALVWFYRATRASLVEPRYTGLLWGWLPWLRPMVRASRTATFVEVFALLLENEAPMADALLLAADATGDRAIRQGAGRLAEAIRRGETFDSDAAGAMPFPPLLRWLMAAGQRQGSLVPTLKHAAETYHRRAQHQAELAQRLLPVVVTVLIGGTFTLLYAAILFVPYFQMLKALSHSL